MFDDLKFADIEWSSKRVPFDRHEKDVAFAFLNDSQRKGRDLCIGTNSVARSADELASLVGQGIFLFCSPMMLGAAFMFVKNDAGRSFFGSQRAVYSSYVGNTNGEGWVAGTIFKSWSVAVTSIGNAYRYKGHS